MNTCPCISLADLAESIKYGYTASATDIPIGPRFLRITDIVPDQIDWDSVPFCEIPDKDKQRYVLAPGDIVIARTGATVGYAKLIRDSHDAVFASYLVRIRINPKLAEPSYVGRIVESEVYKKFVKSRVGGAAQPNANAQVLASFCLPIPDRTVQIRIASILSAYDDLIENNRRRIKLLEESARLLYQEWFINFRFPGHEKTRFNNGLPEGWKKVPLGSCVSLNYGKALKADERAPGEYPVFGSSGIIGYHNKALVKGPGIIVGRKGNVGSVYWSSQDFWPIDTAYFVSSDGANFYLYHALQSIGFMNTDVAVPGLNRDFAYSRELIIPSDKTMIRFNEEIKIIQKQVEILEKYSFKLAEARDLLLPRLMSGEIEV